ncbi:hypothetical protein TRVL_09353 [Trypanosoma vivax]|nr:hypothetical protein TRVL_09353 [Trypanosoma vivax]
MHAVRSARFMLIKALWGNMNSALSRRNVVSFGAPRPHVIKQRHSLPLHRAREELLAKKVLSKLFHFPRFHFFFTPKAEKVVIRICVWLRKGLLMRAILLI